MVLYVFVCVICTHFISKHTKNTKKASYIKAPKSVLVLNDTVKLLVLLTLMRYTHLTLFQRIKSIKTIMTILAIRSTIQINALLCQIVKRNVRIHTFFYLKV